jgi:hypothetical protein
MISPPFYFVILSAWKFRVFHGRKKISYLLQQSCTEICLKATFIRVTDDTMNRRVTISIREEQFVYIRFRYMNLSRFVQEQLDGHMESDSEYQRLMKSTQ